MLTRTARAGTSGSSRSAHSITVTPPLSISSSRPRASSSVRVLGRHAPTCCPDRRPRYSLPSRKVGLVAPLVTPSARTSPCTKTVLPAPSSPVSATTSPAPSVAPRRSPAASVASGEVVVSLARIREPTERLGERLDDVARDQRLFPHPLRRDVAGEAVQVDGARRRTRGVDAAGEQQIGRASCRERV